LIDVLLEDVRARIREYVIGLPSEEHLDTVMLATILLHYVPRREVNAWLVLVVPQGSAKTRLLNLVADHGTVWKLPDKIAAGYFLNSRGMHNSALMRFQNSGARILFMADMSSLSDGVAFQYQGDIDSQFRNIHDGHYKIETGFNSQPVEWGPIPPDETPGFLGAGTEAFYDYLRRSHLLGSRFMVYFSDPARYRHWTDTTDLEEIQRRHPELGPQRDAARAAVHSFLDAAIPTLARFHAVTVPDDVDPQIAAASRFVGRILGAGKLQDSGTRRAIRVRELIRMFAYMRGRDVVTRADAHLGLKIIFSQLPPDQYRIVSYALTHRAKGWKVPDMLAAAGSTRRVLEPLVQALVDIDILEQSGRRGDRGFTYAVTPRARRLIDRFDGGATLFEQNVAPPSAW